jgi:hypothetical protein
MFANAETETFEDFDIGTRFPFNSTSFSSVGNAVLTGASTAFISETGANPFLRYATSGTKFLDVNAGDDFFISFPIPVAGFSFFATDVADNGATLFVETTLNGGNLKSYVVPTAVGPAVDGSVIFVGLLDIEGFDQVRFDLDQVVGDNDFFGFDDFSVFASEQVESDSPTPAPAAMATGTPTLLPTTAATATSTLAPTTAATATPTLALAAATATPTLAPMVAATATPSQISTVTASKSSKKGKGKSGKGGLKSKGKGMGGNGKDRGKGKGKGKGKGEGKGTIKNVFYDRGKGKGKGKAKGKGTI